jgi:hypothetical protein
MQSVGKLGYEGAVSVAVSVGHAPLISYFSIKNTKDGLWRRTLE